jgi:hypothetical protein
MNCILHLLWTLGSFFADIILLHIIIIIIGGVVLSP